MKIDDIYTPLDEVKEEIVRRWNDKELEKKIEKYFNHNIPKVFLNEPKGICTLHLASPNWFFNNFYEKTKKIGLKPIVFEYLDDMFVTTNYDKASLGKMVFFHGRDNQGDMLTSSKHIIDLSGSNEKKKIRNLHTIWDENFVDFHHRLMEEFYEGIEVYDGSKWYHDMGNNPSDYYKYVLALYIRNGVLFEDFLSSGKEEKFTKEVVIPAFKFVEKEFGLRPLIVHVTSKNQADNKYWWCYPKYIKVLVNREMKNKPVI